MKEAIKEKRRGKPRKNILFHQDNTHAHTAAALVYAIDQPPYSPDLAPSGFCLFPNLKEYLRVNRYADNNEVIEAVEGFLEGQEKTFYLKGLETLEKPWCV